MHKLPDYVSYFQFCQWFLNQGGNGRMVIMNNCFCHMANQRKAISLISSWDHCQRSSPWQNSTMLQAGFETMQNLSLGFVEWRCAIVITTTLLQAGFLLNQEVNSWNLHQYAPVGEPPNYTITERTCVRNSWYGEVVVEMVNFLISSSLVAI